MQGQCGGPCASGMECTGYPVGVHIVHCYCHPVAEWRIPWGTVDPETLTCGGSCPDGFACHAFERSLNALPSQIDCLCVPDAYAE